MTLIKAAFCAGSWLRMQRFTVPCPHRALFFLCKQGKEEFFIPELGGNPWPAAQDSKGLSFKGFLSLHTQFLFNFGIKFDPNHFPEPTCCPDGWESDSPAAKSSSQGGWLLGCSLPALHFQMRSHKPPKKTKQLLISGQRGAGGWQETMLGLWENPAFGLCHGSCWLLFPPCHILSLQDVTSLLFPTFFPFFKKFQFQLLHARQPFPLV